MTGVDQVLSCAVSTLSLDVAAVPASGTLLAAFDAVVEACHLYITLSLSVNEKADKIALVGRNGARYLVSEFGVIEKR